MADQLRSIWWADNAIAIIDQTRLPDHLDTVMLGDIDAVVDAISRLAIRGAPALGVIGAMAVALSAQQNDDPAEVVADAERVASTRPTAVNLRWGVQQGLSVLSEGPAAVLVTARQVAEDDIASCRTMGIRGADFLTGLLGERKLRILTHCNAGAFACVAVGTALGVVTELHRRGLVAEVIADETRPLLQGSRITAFELERLGIPYRVTLDSAGPSAIARGLVDVVIVGADRITANGDVCNKIGTMPLALTAARHGVPFLVAAPESTLDAATESGADIMIEERSAEEIHQIGERRWTPAGAGAWNPAFDVTPAEVVTVVVTEARIIRPSLGERPFGQT